MIKSYFDFTNRYLVTFDDQTGEYIRSSVYDKQGHLTVKEPFMGEFPHLLDIGIKGSCEHGISGKCLDAGIYCYQRGKDIIKPDMSLENYIRIMKQCEDKTFQVALGGRGDADCHKDYEAILYESRNHNIIPNITTSGFLFSKEKARITKKYGGAAAVSWYKRSYTYQSIDWLLSEDMTTNIHFILSQESIKEAVELIENDGFPKGISTVVFLLYKPVGYDRDDLILKPDNPYIKQFFELMNRDDKRFRFGFDSCLSPGVLLNCNRAADECIEPCESARYSAYITADMKMYPCSFIQKSNYIGDLNQQTIKEVWNSHNFDKFRKTQKYRCPTCKSREMCLGGCPEITSINLCTLKEKELIL